MTYWPGSNTPKSTNNAFDLSEVRPSIMWTQQGEANAKRLEKDAAQLTAKQRAKKVTSHKPLVAQFVIPKSDPHRSARIRGK